MTYLPIPLAVLYAGLVGTLLALVVAAATNRWSPRVFCLLALRLAIGWHFLFEGLHKIHSHHAGLTEPVTRPFSSEMYFKVAPGPVGAFMRKQYGDPDAVFAARLTPPDTIAPEAFNKLTGEEQAAKCPAAVAQELDALEKNAEESIRARAEADLKAADTTEAAKLKDAKLTDAAKAKAKADAEAARQAARKRADSAKEAGRDLVTAAKATYARWVYGAEGRDTKVKSVSGDAKLTAPERLGHLARLRKELKEEEDQLATGLGNGAGTASKKAADLRADVLAAETDLLRDTTAFVTELKTALNGGKAVEEPKPPRSWGQVMDVVTMWFLVGVGGCLLAGLFTPVACVLAAGFLVMTYLNHPPFPWFPLPPGTEGNPLFVNKNVIECLALLTIATFPTGRWMGLDALLVRACCRRPAPGEPGA